MGALGSGRDGRARIATISLACLALVLGAPLHGGVAHGDARGPVCTTIGCESGVSFTLTALHAQHADIDHVIACVGGRCERFGGRRSGVNVRLARAHGPGPVEVRFLVYGRHGDVLLRLTRSVQLRPWKPNGPDCPPTCWVRSLRVDPQARRLVATD
jgi:hypothetical protein